MGKRIFGTKRGKIDKKRPKFFLKIRRNRKNYPKTLKNRFSHIDSLKPLFYNLFPEPYEYLWIFFTKEEGTPFPKDYDN
jgi:hypothetical protein